VILAAGLTPAWQQIMRFHQVELGEVNRAAEVHWCASGKAINVGMALAALGVPAHTLSPAGGWSGSALRAEFVERGLKATWTPTLAGTRVCTTVLNEADGKSTELVGNAAAMTETELADFQTKYQVLAAQAQMVVLTGSLPTGTPAMFYQGLLEGTACPVVLDARGPELLATLAFKPRVVKPNREELALTVGRPLPDDAAVLSAMRELIERGAQAVVVTNGKGPVRVMEGREVRELTPPALTPIVNPIGCGDCLAAGLAWGLARGDTLIDAVRLGLAAAGDNLTQLLPARLSQARITAILSEVPAPRIHTDPKRKF
jgi:1-phosphofructokinase family hexose kinase